MSEFILHHYDLSPFSEKIRLLLGHTQLPWHSVITSPFLPRPFLMPLTGGYRRIPVAQIGADIYCDSRVISQTIASLSDKPGLYRHPESSDSEAANNEVVATSSWADTELFKMCILSTASLKYMRNFSGKLKLLDVPKFIVDRYKLAKGSTLNDTSPKRAAKKLEGYLGELNHAIKGDFRFGDQPTIADFSLYHPLWFTQEVAEAGFLKPYPRIQSWYQRMQSIGHGQPATMTEQQALQQAKEASPEALENNVTEEDTALLNQPVSMVPADYGFIPVHGNLVYSDEQKRVVQIHSDKAGVLNVHFPKEGFEMAPAGASDL